MSAPDPNDRLTSAVTELRKEAENIREWSSRLRGATGAFRVGYLVDLLDASRRVATHTVELACAASILLYEAQKESP